MDSLLLHKAVRLQASREAAIACLLWEVCFWCVFCRYRPHPSFIFSCQAGCQLLLPAMEQITQPLQEETRLAQLSADVELSRDECLAQAQQQFATHQAAVEAQMRTIATDLLGQRAEDAARLQQQEVR
jgi:hypothetical protein